jgi:hypothetical protein
VSQAHVTGTIKGAPETGWVGGVVGINWPGGKILDSDFSGSVSGTSNVGGVVGELYQFSGPGLISGSHASGQVNLYDPHTGEGELQTVGGLVGTIFGDAAILHSSATNVVTDNLNDTLAGGLLGWNGGGLVSDSYATGSVSLSTAFGYVGGLIGSNGGAVVRSYATGPVSSTNNVAVGGLAGENEGIIQTSFATGPVTATGGAYIGGLVGDDGSVVPAEIDDSYATGKVMGGGRDYIGGLAGVMTGVINRSFATGDVVEGDSSVYGSFVGGLVGQSETYIQESFATGSVSAGTYALAGGLLGESVRSEDGVVTVANTYATGNVTGGDNATVGGLIGKNDNNLQSSYSSGAVSTGANGKLGGLIGDHYQTDGNDAVTSSYWDVTTSGTDQPTSEGGFNGMTGLTDTQLKSGLPGGFDAAIWDENAGTNGGLPYLRATHPALSPRDVDAAETLGKLHRRMIFRVPCDLFKSRAGGQQSGFGKFGANELEAQRHACVRLVHRQGE